MLQEELTGLILAGGQGRRMGGVDKGLIDFQGRPLVTHVRERLAGRVAEVLINANRSRQAYAALADRVIADIEGDFQGPLMGIYSGLCAATTPWLIVVPCDTPMLPQDLVARLVAGRGEADIAVAWDGERLHPVVALIRTALAGSLERALVAGERGVARWYAGHAWRRVDFADCAESFTNLNTPAERAQLLTRPESLPGQKPSGASASGGLKR